MKETTRPPKSTPPQPNERVPGVRRRVNTPLQRFVLRMLASKGPQAAPHQKDVKTYDALVTQGYASKRKDGKYEITPLGIEMCQGQKMGRPTKFEDRWLAFVEHYGGAEKLSSLIPCSYNALNRWALHGRTPLPLYRSRIEELAKEAGLPSPLEEAV